MWDLMGNSWAHMLDLAWICVLNLHSKTWKRNMKMSHRAQGFRPVSKFSHLRGSKEHNNTVTLHSVKDVLKFLEGKISLLSCDWRDWKAWGTCAEHWEVSARESPPCPCDSTAGLTHFFHLSKGDCKMYRKKQISWTHEFVSSERCCLNRSGELFTYSG